MTDLRARLQSRIVLLYKSRLYIYCTGADCGILYIVSDITNHGVVSPALFHNRLRLGSVLVLLRSKTHVQQRPNLGNQ